MALDLATEHGFTMMTTPTLVRPEIMNGTGFNVKHDDEIYARRDDCTWSAPPRWRSPATTPTKFSTSRRARRSTWLVLLLPPRGRLRR